MCNLKKTGNTYCIENIDEVEIQSLYRMINNTGLLERRIFNDLKEKIKKLIVC